MSEDSLIIARLYQLVEEANEERKLLKEKLAEAERKLELYEWATANAVCLQAVFDINGEREGYSASTWVPDEAFDNLGDATCSDIFPTVLEAIAGLKVNIEQKK